MRSATQVIVVPLRSNRLRLWTIRDDRTIWSRCEGKPRYFKPWEPDTDCWNPAPPPFAAAWCTAAPLSDKSIQFWASDTDGAIWSCRETGPNPEDRWTPWSADWARSAPPFEAQRIAVAPLSDGRLQFWAVDEMGAIWSCWMRDRAPGSEWTNWTDRWTPRRPSFRSRAVASAPLSDGRLQFWAIDETGTIRSCVKSTRKSTAQWTPWAEDWAAYTPFRAATVVAAALADKRLQLWAVDEDGKIWSAEQSSPAGSSWEAWSQDWLTAEPPFQAMDVAIAPMIDKRLQFWAVDADGNVWNGWQMDASPGAKWSILGLFFTMQSQQQTFWCWAATAASLSRYYDPASAWEQCDVACEVFHNRSCCENGRSSGCNQTTFLKPVLDLTRNFASSASGAALQERLLAEFREGRPVAARMYSPSKGGHFVVVCGCGAGMVMVKDPWDGPTCIPYDVFCKQYMGTHEWHTTFFTKPQGGP